MSRLGYYIYAIRGRWMDRFKIGYYIADLYDLIKRYKTYYGLDIELYVFEVFCSRKEIKNIEKQVHMELMTWIIDESELYYSDCLNTFIEKALILTNNSVTIPLKKNAKKSKKKKDIVEDKKLLNSEIERINNDVDNSNIKKTYENIKHIIRVDNTDIVNINHLNTDPDKLPCCNGIIDLRTGILEKIGKTSGIPIIYRGISYPTHEIDNFMKDIFNNDAELIHYVQKLLGYGITGNNSEQMWVIFSGTGSNGKGLLIRMIQKVMDKYCLTAPNEIFYKEKKYNNTNGPTPYLSVLHNKRFVVKNEFDIEKTLNEDLLKSITGQDMISTKNNYAKYYLEFTPCVLPILSCNKKPKINIYLDSDVRRVIVIPFENTYAKINDPKLPYNSNNKYHKLRNDNYDQMLMNDNCMEQLLTWLVNGSVKWYREKLNDIPTKVNDIISKYHNDNDTLQQFINECCSTNEEYNINAGDFRNKYNEYTKTNISQDDLRELMRKKDFEYGRPYVDGKRIRSYIGLKLQ